MIRRLWQHQDGATMVIVLAFMLVAVPLTTASLALASTLSIDSRVKTASLKSTYATIGGVEDAQYRLVYEAGYADSLPLGQPTNYTINLNGIDVTVTVVKTATPPPPPAIPPGISSRSYQIVKEVSPTTVAQDTQTTYTYTATITNGTDTEKTVTNIKDDFPSGLTYVTGSTSGLTTSDPSIVAGNLMWNLTSAEGALAPFGSKVIQFQMQGSLSEDVHCNDIWVSPGGDKTRSGMTAKITVGSPASTLCPGTAIQLTKAVDPAVVPAVTPTTFTYTLTFTSDGTDSVDVSKVIDLMPPGFSYVNGSSQGLTTTDPAIVLKNYGTQEHLTWSANPIGTVAPGGSEVLTFQATASLQAGDYYNEAYATVSGLNYDLYTWPTAKVQVIRAFEVEATDGRTTTSSNTWLVDDGAVTDRWTITAQ